MTSAEWLVDAVMRISGWESAHAQLDKDRAALPSAAARETMRASGARMQADQLDAIERGLSDVMRDLDAQVKRTVADVAATVPTMGDEDRVEARHALATAVDQIPRARWALALLDGPRVARGALRGAARAAGKVIPLWLLMVAVSAIGRRS